MTVALDLAVLRDVSGEVPWEGLEALIGAALGEEGAVEVLLGRYRELYEDDPYEAEEYEVVYLPFVLTEVARRGSTEQRRRIIEALLGRLRAFLETDDEGGYEFAKECLESLPIEDVAPRVVEVLEGWEGCATADDAMTFWDLLEPVAERGAAETKARVAECAMNALRYAHDRGEASGTTQFLCYCLALMKHKAALPLMEAAEKKLRGEARNRFEEVDANGVREAIDILEGREEPYGRHEGRSLTRAVEAERKLYGEWYGERKNPRRETGWEEEEDEEEERMMPVYSDATLSALGFGEDDRPFVQDGKIGRNDPCPCGSGKKYKKCCGKG
jgi:hypothetical protein